MRDVPASLRAGPFTRQQAIEAGVTDRMLEGRRFVRVLPRVWRFCDYEMTEDDWVAAATLCLPERAHLTGISRLRRLGLDHGAVLPVRFVVEGDLHLAYREIFVHRTDVLPPTDDVGVTPAAAYIAYCAEARVIEAIQVGDWLLHHHHTSVTELHAAASAAPWRAGAQECLWVLGHLDGTARSLKESETRALLVFAGLPRPECNVPIMLEGVTAIADMAYPAQRSVVEYEGSQHQQSRAQYSSDIDRYALFRVHDVAYVQVTKEKLAAPRSMVGEVYRMLLSRGFNGDPPTFGAQWALLFQPVADQVSRRRGRSGPRRSKGWRGVATQ